MREDLAAECGRTEGEFRVSKVYISWLDRRHYGLEI